MYLETCAKKTQHAEPNESKIAERYAVNRERNDNGAGAGVDDSTNIDDTDARTNKTNAINSTENNNVVTFFVKVDLNKLPPDLQLLIPAIKSELPDGCELPAHKPEWLDMEKVKKGQQFAEKYLFGLNYSQTLSLLFLLSSSAGIEALIYTEKSHTPFLAHKRYLSTVLRVQSWYQSEFWKPGTKGYKNLKYVRSQHSNVSKRLNRLPVDEKVRKDTNLDDKLKSIGSHMLCPLLNTLKKDFDKSTIPACPVHIDRADRIHFNQFEMAVTQFGFFGLMVVYPEKFAAKNATKEELANFIHLWRYLGYLLGINEEFNICQGDVDTVLQRCRHVTEYMIKPSVLKVNKEWEHMSRCALQGVEKFTKLRINFEATILYLCYVLDIKTPHLTQYVGWKELMMFNITKLVMCDGQKLPGFVKFFNYYVKRILENAEKQRDNETKHENVSHL